MKRQYTAECMPLITQKHKNQPSERKHFEQITGAVAPARIHTLLKVIHVQFGHSNQTRGNANLVFNHQMN
jgi:hypothetical protein